MIKIVSEKRANKNEIYSRFELIINSKFIRKIIKFIEKIFPSDANFVLIKVDNASKRYNQLIDFGIVIRNRTTQLLCENCLRITIGTNLENEKLINVLRTL